MLVVLVNRLWYLLRQWSSLVKPAAYAGRCCLPRLLSTLDSSECPCAFFMLLMGWRVHCYGPSLLPGSECRFRCKYFGRLTPLYHHEGFLAELKIIPFWSGACMVWNQGWRAIPANACDLVPPRNFRRCGSGSINTISGAVYAIPATWPWRNMWKPLLLYPN
jgi:hypothetical protein